MKKEGFIAFLLVAVIAVIGGFFIFESQSQAHLSFNLLPLNDGNLAGNPTWSGTGCEQGSSGGNDYIIMKTATSSLLSPTVNLTTLVETKLSFQARTYNGTSTISNKIVVSVSNDNGVSWTEIAAIYPTSSSLKTQPTIDLAGYLGTIIRIKFETPGATGSKGIGLDDLALSGKTVNLSPAASTTDEEETSSPGELIGFNGSPSTDTDGYIISYFWNFGDGSSSTLSTTSYAYAATGTYDATLTVTDDDSATTSENITISIIDNFLPATATPAATTTDFGQIVINEFVADSNDGDKEWIELFNQASTSVDLSGWTFRDNASTSTLSGSIGASTSEKYYVWEFNSGRLNNDGDIITIRDTAGKLIDQIAYGNWNDGNLGDNAPSPAKGNAAARRSDGLDTGNNSADFAETITPTKGAANIITAKPAAASGGGSSYSQKTAAIATSASTTETLSSTTKIIINEIFPNPIGDDADNEFIELKNLSAGDIDLAGWAVGDKSGKYKLPADQPASTTIKAGGYLAIYRRQSKIAFNNTGEEWGQLYAPDGSLIDSVKYDGAAEGQSFSRNNEDDWDWTATPTPGAENIFSSVASKKIDASSSAEIIISSSSWPLDISEILPNPSGADAENEFIELYNPNDQAIDLTGYKLAVKSSHYLIKNRVIGAKSYLALYRPDTKITLNNTGDTLRLYDPAGRIISQVGYQKTFSDLSLALASNGQFRWTNFITPGRANIFPANLNITAVQATPSTKKKKTAKGIIEVPLTQVRDYDDGQQVRVNGVVAVEPGTLGVNIFYLAGSGIQIYSYKKDFPELKLGDQVQISGALASSGGERRIKISSSTDIRLISHGDPPPPHEISAAEIGANTEGWLVTISGDVVDAKGSDIYLDDGTDEVRVYLKTNLDPKDVNANDGDHLTVTGIVSQTKSGYRLLPRYLSDFDFGQVKGTSTPAAPAAVNKITTTDKYLLALIAFLLAIISWLVWSSKRNKSDKNM